MVFPAGSHKKKIKLMLIYPMKTGRNFDEVLPRRWIPSNSTATHTLATPVNWKKGEGRDHSPPSVTDEVAKQKYPGGWKTLKPYLRIVPQPK